MRLSANELDPGYDPAGYMAEITLDGERIEHVVTADEEQGMVLVHVWEDGVLKLDPSGDRVATEVRKGVVRIILPPDVRDQIERRRGG